jgi:hypothetical protein
MKITKQRLKEIIREELEYTADIEQYPEVPEDEPSGPSAAALTILRPLHAMSEKFSNYLESNGIPDEYEAIKQHLIELGLESNEAGIYALYGMK